MIVTNVPEYLMTPPPYQAKETVTRLDMGEPNVDSLIGEQRTVYDELIEYIENRNDPGDVMVVLKGYAGTGKTYLITQVLKHYVRSMGKKIAITAPTNKAVKVLKNTANFEHHLIVFKTIHKLLALKPGREDRTGKLTFSKEYGEDSEVNEQYVLIVDETSMLNDDLYDMIREETLAADRYYHATGTRAGLKIIFLGDPIQIPPVGKANCAPFNPAKCIEHGIKQLELTQIIRQKEGNPILDLATTIRTNYLAKYIPYERETKITDQGGVMFIAAADKAVLYNLCESYFKSENFDKDSDFIKVIAYTNKVVDFMNAKIRSFIYAEQYSVQTLPKIVAGDRLIADAPIVEDLGFKKIMKFQTNDEFEVISTEISSRNLFENLEVKIYVAKVKYWDQQSLSWKLDSVDIIHEDSEKTYDEVMANIKKKALEVVPDQRGMWWKIYYGLEEKFARVKYNYAITAHKSQGSTYDNAIVIMADIDTNFKIEERNRIKYVAVTRARNHLFIVE